jgi:hypothetical protein
VETANTRQIQMSIFQNLPNDLIMRIIREADGGLVSHKKKMNALWKEQVPNGWKLGKCRFGMRLRCVLPPDRPKDYYGNQRLDDLPLTCEI